jgi:hypothetical protein
MRNAAAIILLALLAGALAAGCGDSSVSADGGDADADGDSDADGDTDDDPLVCETPADAGGFAFERIATWRDDAKAAYSIVHDDFCDFGVRGIQENALPALDDRGLEAALGTIVAECEAESLWDVVADADAAGHEIANHSYNHENVTLDNAATEVADAKATLEEHTSRPVSFYVFPYDYFTADTIAAVEEAGHLGARGGNRDDNDGFDNPPINGAEPENDYEVEFDVWPRTYSKYALYYPQDILSVHIWNAIDAGGWALREFHSVMPDGDSEAGNGFGPIELSDYEAHLDFLVDAWRKNYVWTATPSEVIKYRRARTACGAAVADDTIAYDTSSGDCATYATPISVIVSTGNDVPSVQGLQNGEPVVTRKIGPSAFAIDADPTLGDVVLSGCADDGPTVEDGEIAARPIPADSVCDIETIVGDGSDGMMDDLERPFEDFQVLPNPSQGDGRNGSWSWYPENVTVEMFMEGDNTVLRYAGEDLGAWTGVTLAFLGGNGAGTCYDASAYSGIRFKIKGAVATTDELNGQVILSVVTAETQTQKYGGDLDGEGGHFHAMVPVTADWQTVSIAWADLAAPTWGDTMDLTAVALGKMQALDWGISNTATSFEVFLDDIELY